MAALRRAALALLLAAATPAAEARVRPAPQARSQARSQARATPRAAKRTRAEPKGNTLDRARSLLAAVKRDPAKRRYRHNWERAIRALTRAAKGRDAPAALLEAAKARYGLYRFSAIESDREEALRLAARTEKLGSRDAASFAAAIRREAGDDEPPKVASRPPAKPVATPSKKDSVPAVPGPPPHPDPLPEGEGTVSAKDEEESSEPELEDAAADVSDEATKDGKPAVPTPAGDEPARVSEVKAWSNADYTRVAIYLSRPVEFEKEELAAAGDRPRRLALDLKPAFLEGRALAHPVGDALVQRVRAAQHDPETVRVVLDLAGSDAYQLFQLDDPPRLIVDVGTRQAARDAQRAAPPLTPTLSQRERGEGDAPGASPVTPTLSQGERGEGDAPGESPLTPALSQGERGEGAATEPAAEGSEAGARPPIRRVVIDAGHGGHDTGAIGPRRVREKEVVLAMARKVAQKLEAAGLEVVLTRRDDTFIPLEERTAIANTSRADLFVSIHANAHPRRDRRGVETYFLNVTDDRYAARLAARENGALSPEAGSGREVQRILTDLDAKTSAEASRRLALLVQKEVCGGVRGRVGEVRDLGVKSALFYVLLGARMPAVLVETAFISNRDEEKRLASVRYQDEVASAIARAVVSFSGRAPHVASR